MEQLLVLAVIVIAFGFCREAVAKKPTIMPENNEIIIQEGNDLRIECYGEGGSVQFSFPKRTFMSPRTIHNIIKNDNGTSTFLRQNAVYLDTGWYACAADDIEINNDFKNLNHEHNDIAWIYIYVKSSKPFADFHYTFPKSIITLPGHPAVVPCRPTSPGLDVQLWRNSEIVQQDETNQFNPQIGFILKKLIFRDLVVHFQCKINDVVDRYDLYYSQAIGRKPRMNPSDEELFLREGDALRIQCLGRMKIQFSFPNIYRSENDSVLTTSKYIIHEHNGTSTFLRRKVRPDDSGWYGCAEEGINMEILFVNYIEYTKTDINWIYVYVESRFAILLGESDNVFKGYMDGSDVDIPCRPTSLSSKVILKLDSEIVELDENVRFDPKFGFIVKRGLNNSASYYECKTNTSIGSVSVYLHKLSEQVANLLVSPMRYVILTGEDLYLPCIIYSEGNDSDVDWMIPITESENRIEYTKSVNLISEDFDLYFKTNILTIKNMTENDSGQYNCVFNDSILRSFRVFVFDQKGRDYENLNLQDDAYEFVRLQNESIKLIADLQVFSGGAVEWIGPSNQSIEHTVAFNLSKRKFHLMHGLRDLIEIHNLTFYDSGVYQMKINTQVGMMSINLTINVQAPPIVYIEDAIDPYFATHDEAFPVYCCTTGSPRPNITWSFLKLPDYPFNNNSVLVHPLGITYESSSETSWCSFSNITTDVSGIVTCTSCNLINCTAATRKILFSDSVGRFGIIGPKEQPFIGDDITLTCAGSIHSFRNVSWVENFDECYEEMSGKMFEIEKDDATFSKRELLLLRNVAECNHRLYSCSGETIDGNLEISTYQLNLSTPQEPLFRRKTLDGLKIILNPEVDQNKTQSLICCADGEPRPIITWFKNDVLLKESQEHHFSPDNCELTVLLDLRDRHDRRYTCIARNRFGEKEAYTYFQIKGNDEVQQLDRNLISLNICFAFLLIGMIVAWIILRKRRIKRARRKFKQAILERFDEGALDYVQPHVNIADQAEILPYDEKWEYPRKLIKLGKILGSGAFGIVRKAEAKSIHPGKPVTTVAVKMVRATHRLHYMTALTRELKVLVYLGEHLNIVNLLGACTKNVSYGQLLVIVEFCRFGNIHDYLFRGRADFIDQIDPVTEEIIGPNLGLDRVNTNQENEDVMDRDANSDSENSCHSTDSKGFNANANDEVLADVSFQPGMRCHYRGDDPDMVVEPICTKDLLCWAWQVTRGMRYLGFRKVVHGDLAARNILLADNNVIKICDFGLAEILYKDDDYKKLGEDPLPLQWMAIESINNRIFSNQSDIWSFGVLLWEMFTLAETPYRGINPRSLYQKLSGGYRLSRPKYAPEYIYRMMLNCWKAEPSMRPPFLKIEEDIAKLLDNGIHTYYMDMKPLYAELNDKASGDEKIDYLTMDPSKIKTVLFNSSQEKVKLSNIPFNKSCHTPCPESSSNDTLSDVCSTTT